MLKNDFFFRSNSLIVQKTQKTVFKIRIGTLLGQNYITFTGPKKHPKRYQDSKTGFV